MGNDSEADVPARRRRNFTRLFFLEHEARLSLDHTRYLRGEPGEERRQRNLDSQVIVGNVYGPRDQLRKCAQAEIEAVARPSLIFDPKQWREARGKVCKALPHAAGGFLLSEAVRYRKDERFGHRAILRAWD
jgi:hypothetical protein